MNIELNDQELEDLKNVIYEKMKALDSETAADNTDSRKKRLADRLEKLYEKLRE